MWEYRDKIIHFRVVYSLKHFIFVKELNIGYLVVMAKILKLGANRKWYKKSWEIRTWKYLKINWKMHNYVLEWRKEAKSISRINIMHKNMHYKKIIIDIFAVTFRKEGVDWNNGKMIWKCAMICHLPQGRCGLKSACHCHIFYGLSSLSAGKVWIEIGEQGKWVFWVLRHLLQMAPISQIW